MTSSNGILHGAAILLLFSALAGPPAFSETLTLPINKRPEWLKDGIVMAGSWEPLLFRVRRDGSSGYQPTAEQLAGYAREHSPEMVAELKALGVNFVMLHAYKGFGLGAERESMADAVRFAKLCHEAGLRVGVYNCSGTLGWELLFNETPAARDWVVLEQSAQPRTYGSARYRYYWNRNHPGAQAFYKELIRFAVEDIQTDLIHLDNYNVGPGYEALSVQRFRQYLRKTFTSRELRSMGISDIKDAFPPTSQAAEGLLRRAWSDFCSESLADSYRVMSRYARTLRKDILMECNPGGPGARIRPPVHHGRLLPGGEAFWDEDAAQGFRDGTLRSRIRTYKMARAMNNIAFAYSTTPLQAAEAMAFNLDCLGCICWFEYGKLAAMPGVTNAVSAELAPFVRFYRERHDLFRDTTAVADVAVLRSFPSQVFADAKWAQLNATVEQTLIEHRVPFQIIYDQQLNELRRYRAVVLAGCIAMSEQQANFLRKYVRSGGRLCVIGPVATHDQWLQARAMPALDDLPSDRVARFSESISAERAVGDSCDGRLSLSVEAPIGLCAELTEQRGRRLVHLVNYRSDAPVTNALVQLMLPPGKKTASVQLSSPEREQSQTLAFQEQAGAVLFTVPGVNVYEVAVVEFR
jgi:hypothetical protein